MLASCGKVGKGQEALVSTALAGRQDISTDMSDVKLELQIT